MISKETLILIRKNIYSRDDALKLFYATENHHSELAKAANKIAKRYLDQNPDFKIEKPAFDHSTNKLKDLY